jgi:hypothetical protein
MEDSTSQLTSAQVSGPSQSPKNKPSRKRPQRTAKEILASIPPLPDFNPLPRAQEPREPTIQLPRVLNVRDPYVPFTQFLTEQHFEIISTNTNLYAAQHGAGEPGKRFGKDTTASDIRVFVGILIYMGVFRLDSN